LGKKIGFTEHTVKLHLSRVTKLLADPESLDTPMPAKGKPGIDVTNPDKFAALVAGLSAPGVSASKVAREVGVSPDIASKIAKLLEGQLQPLKREIEDVRIEDLTKRFGTLSRDAIDAITPEKLLKASARDLAIVAAVGIDKWQLLRGQPTQRMELSDRREMNEVLKLIVSEAKRRNIEIDVTPEGGVTAKKSPHKNMADQKLKKQIMSGNPAGTLVPA